MQTLREYTTNIQPNFMDYLLRLPKEEQDSFLSSIGHSLGLVNGVTSELYNSKSFRQWRDLYTGSLADFVTKNQHIVPAFVEELKEATPEMNLSFLQLTVPAFVEELKEANPEIDLGVTFFDYSADFPLLHTKPYDDDDDDDDDEPYWLFDGRELQFCHGVSYALPWIFSVATGKKI